MAAVSNNSHSLFNLYLFKRIHVRGQNMPWHNFIIWPSTEYYY